MGQSKLYTVKFLTRIGASWTRYGISTFCNFPHKLVLGVISVTFHPQLRIYREYHHYTTNYCLCLYTSGKPAFSLLRKSDQLHNYIIKLINTFPYLYLLIYYGIVNQVHSMVYPTSVNP